MRLPMLGLCLLSTATVAGPPSPEMMKEMLANPWDVEFITQDGKYSRIAGYPSKETCDSAIPKVLGEQSGFDGHCVYMEWSTGRILGTQDPEWIALNERHGGWSVEFIDSMGKWSRIGGYQSKVACEAVIHALPKSQGGDGHCVLGEWKDGRVVFFGSQDPAWTGK